MTVDHAVLTAIWTAYIFAGSYFKDRRLERYIGEPYRVYARSVTGFPVVGFGPWEGGRARGAQQTVEKGRFL